MYVVMGATGHVGSAVMDALLQKKADVVALTHDANKRAMLEARGAQAAVADVCDVEALRAVFARGDRAFILNPPGDPSGDAAAAELRTIDCIVRALHGSGLKKVVVESTFGAQPGNQVGDLATLYELEQRIAAMDIASTVVRAAYYMSNWDMSLESAMKDGVVPTLYPVDMPLPMAAPTDLGRVGAELLSSSSTERNCVYAEGPQRYSSNDVAAAFATALGRRVVAREIPRAEWMSFLQGVGFSRTSAESFIGMTALTREGDFPDVSATIHRRILLQEYVNELVNRARNH